MTKKGVIKQTGMQIRMQLGDEINPPQYIPYTL